MTQLYDAIGIGYRNYRCPDPRLAAAVIRALGKALGDVAVYPLLVPYDCADGLLGAYWRRPYAYLDPGVRSAISTFSKIGDTTSGLARLRSDLADGTWKRRYGFY
jgi:hypothetical protein